MMMTPNPFVWLVHRHCGQRRLLIAEYLYDLKG
jgi:hypothetical protein